MLPALMRTGRSFGAPARGGRLAAEPDGGEGLSGENARCGSLEFSTSDGGISCVAGSRAGGAAAAVVTSHANVTVRNHMTARNPGFRRRSRAGRGGGGGGRSLGLQVSEGNEHLRLAFVDGFLGSHETLRLLLLLALYLGDLLGQTVLRTRPCD